MSTLASHDPRMGKPSASTMLRTKHCPSWLARLRWAMDHHLPVDEEEESPFAKFGSCVHEQVAWSLGKNKSATLQPSIPPGVDEAGVLDAAEQITSGVLRVAESSGVTDKHVMTTELRLWKNYSSFPGTPPPGFGYSGQYDVAFVDESYTNSATIIDAKTGWRKVESVHRNLQMRTLAVLAASVYEVDHVTVAIVQPNFGSPAIVGYNRVDLARARWEIDNIVIKANQASPSSDLHPSANSCRYCPVRRYCPAAHQVFMKVATGDLPNEHHLRLEYVEVAELVIDDIRRQASDHLMKHPGTVPGWKISEGSTVRVIPAGIDNVIQRLKGVIEEDKIRAIAKVGVGDLEDVCVESYIRRGLQKREAKVAAKMIVQSVVKEVKRPGSLTRDHTTAAQDPSLNLQPKENEPPF